MSCKKPFLLVCLVLLTFLKVHAQTESYFCTPPEDSSLYRIAIDWEANIEIKMNGEWKSFSVFDDNDIDHFGLDCERIELNHSGQQELVLHWERRYYGSGGGTVVRNIQIWDLDNGQRLLDEITYCSDESFGRHGDSYFVYCQTPISPEEGGIRVNEKSCKTERSENGAGSDPTENCKLSGLSAGLYHYENEEWVMYDKP